MKVVSTPCLQDSHLNLFAITPSPLAPRTRLAPPTPKLLACCTPSTLTPVLGQVGGRCRCTWLQTLWGGCFSNEGNGHVHSFAVCPQPTQKLCLCVASGAPWHPIAPKRHPIVKPVDVAHFAGAQANARSGDATRLGAAPGARQTWPWVACRRAQHAGTGACNSLRSQQHLLVRHRQPSANAYDWKVLWTPSFHIQTTKWWGHVQWPGPKATASLNTHILHPTLGTSTMRARGQAHRRCCGSHLMSHLATLERIEKTQKTMS